MNLYAKITTDTGKVIGKGANKYLTIEVLDGKQTLIFSKKFFSSGIRYKCNLNGCNNLVEQKGELCDECVLF